jgi:5-hydroxyisourate hydrolase-like protein (transthyretin family)
MSAPGILVLALAGCSGTSDPIACTTQFVYGTTVHVVDSITGQPASDGLSGTAEDGSYTEAMTAFGSDLVGAGERAGTYTVTVTATDYLEWSTSEVVVTADECHVIPVSLEPRLQLAG